MLFNSLVFAAFLPITFFSYWFLTNKSLKLQNFLVLVVSYIFYGWWDWRFLSLIITSTAVDYFVAKALGHTEQKRKRNLLISVSLLFNLGMLGFFKYYNFFVDSFVQLFETFGISLSVNSLNIILPVGISFYTFQTLSYTIDVYRKKLSPTNDFIAFGAFVAFFPQLIAGPIERALDLLPQFQKKRLFNFGIAYEGIIQFSWGLFKKVVIADNCAEFANMIFNDHQNYGGGALLIGAFFFAFQIYGDFSGYSDMAIGIAKLFGFRLTRNFATPYFSRDIAEFWRRWHISLSSWFRDYLYIPLGGSKGSLFKVVRNVFIIFLVSGLWHGANWTFVIWGGLNALYFIPLLLLRRNRRNISFSVGEGRRFPSFKEMLQMFSTFVLTLYAWVFFRSENLKMATDIIEKMLFDLRNLSNIFSKIMLNESAVLLLLLPLFIVFDYMFRNKDFPFFQKMFYNDLMILILFSLIFLFGAPEAKFIYFNF